MIFSHSFYSVPDFDLQMHGWNACNYIFNNSVKYVDSEGNMLEAGVVAIVEAEKVIKAANPTGYQENLLEHQNYEHEEEK